MNDKSEPLSNPPLDEPNETPPVGAIERTGSFLPSQIGEIPRTPGVYIMFDARNKVIYVGKAINLRGRVRQYFMESGGDSRPSIPFIRRAVEHIETIVTNTEKEAFLLENTLIKRYRPRYNVQLCDDKTYVSVRINLKSEWPRAEVTRQRDHDKALYLGPYTSAQAIRQTLNLLQKLFPIRSCTDAVLHSRKRPCILHAIGRCSAPCVGKVSPEEYQAYVQATIQFLKGHTRELIDSLYAEMLESSRALDYEKAALLRDRIVALEQTTESQRVASSSIDDLDAVGYFEQQGRAAFAVLRFRSGQLNESQNWIVQIHGRPLAETLPQFLGQYYGALGQVAPREVLLPNGFGPLNAILPEHAMIEEWLSDQREGRVSVAQPQRGDKLSLVEMASSNAREVLLRKLSGQQEVEAVLDDLARRLHLDVPPQTIECYDIATLQGSLTAASRVVFMNGEPHKAGYRIYRIKTVEGQDDFASMREVLERRFRRATAESETLPDLVLIDGGKGQLAIAVAVLEELGIQGVALAGLAKSHLKPDTDAADPHQKVRTPERLFLPGRKNPVPFPPHAPSFYLLQRARDEAHRFVNTYHSRLRSRTHLRSSLQDIPGVGERRAKAILRHFGSLARARQATIDELQEAPTVTRPIAEAIYGWFHGDTAATESFGK